MDSNFLCDNLLTAKHTVISKTHSLKDVRHIRINYWLQFSDVRRIKNGAGVVGGGLLTNVIVDLLVHTPQ
jgi:hypothetical protein